jgi:hypothetical protein
MCIDLDTQISPDSERAKTGVLSAASDELLRECWKTWRLSDPFRSVLYLELVTHAIDNQILEIEYARDAMRSIDKSLKENEIANWTINDVSSKKRYIKSKSKHVCCMNSVKLWSVCMKV